MKKVKADAKYNELKVIAKELGINYVGKKTEQLINLINEEIEKRQGSKNEKWYANGYGFQEGDKIEIIKKVVKRKGEVEEILQGRKAIVVGPSSKKNNLNAYLIDDKTGEQLNCLITFEVDLVFLAKEEVKAA